MPNRVWHYGVVVVFSLIWSSAFIAGKIAIVEFDPSTVLSLRFLISSLILLSFCVSGKVSILDRRVVGVGLLLGLLNNAIYLGLTFSALEFIRPALVIVIVSCAPFITSLLAATLGLETITPLSALGVVVGFIGVLVISGWQSLPGADLTGIGLALAGTVAFSIGTVLFRGKASDLPVQHVNFWQSIAGAVALLPAAALHGRALVLPSTPVALAILYLAVVVTIGGMALWLFLIRTSGAGTASSYHLLNPFFGVLLAHLVLGTALRAADFAGAAIIALGLLLTIHGKKEGNRHEHAGRIAR